MLANFMLAKNAAAAYGGPVYDQSCTETCAPEEPFLSAALKLVAEANERVGLLNDRLNRIEASVFGAPLKDGCAKTAPKPVPAGAAGALREELRDLIAALGATSAAVDNLDRIA